jgi:hypothetical protein
MHACDLEITTQHCCWALLQLARTRDFDGTLYFICLPTREQAATL